MFYLTAEKGTAPPVSYTAAFVPGAQGVALRTAAVTAGPAMAGAGVALAFWYALAPRIELELPGVLFAPALAVGAVLGLLAGMPVVRLTRRRVRRSSIRRARRESGDLAILVLSAEGLGVQPDGLSVSWDRLGHLPVRGAPGGSLLRGFEPGGRRLLFVATTPAALRAAIAQARGTARN